MCVSIAVGLGEVVVSRKADDVLTAYGLGSCLAIAMYDPAIQLCGLLHAVLPIWSNGCNNPSKYVDSGIKVLLDMMVKNGAHQSRLLIRLAGGANILTAPGFNKTFDIGTRNIQSAHETLDRMQLCLKKEDVGGHMGRTVRFYVGNCGFLTVRAIGGKEVEL